MAPHAERAGVRSYSRPVSPALSERLSRLAAEGHPGRAERLSPAPAAYRACSPRQPPPGVGSALTGLRTREPRRTWRQPPASTQNSAATCANRSITPFVPARAFPTATPAAAAASTPASSQAPSLAAPLASIASGAAANAQQPESPESAPCGEQALWPSGSA
jgi:hypothetical protein